MLELSAVSCRINGTMIIENIDLQVHRGVLTVMLGPSGAGKTTLLRIAAGIIAPTTGTCINGFARTAMVFQEPRLLPWANAIDNIALALERSGEKRSLRRARAALWLEKLGFAPADYFKRPPQLSGGMRARVAIARAFSIAPDLVLMDEPFAALDLGLRRDLQALTRTLAIDTGSAILFVTHDLPEAVRLADSIIVLSGRPGRLTAHIPNTPVESLADVWNAAATLSRRPEIAPILDAESTDAPYTQ